MGFHTKSYDLNEISNLKDRGNIIPTLFWAIPIGKWSDGEISTLWHQFTQSHEDSSCENVGLLLVKDGNDRNSEPNSNNIDLSPLSASLKELFPKKHNCFDLNSSKAILILSGNYPQPGWGVCIDHSKKGGSDFLARINNVLNSETYVDIIKFSKDAITSHKQFKDIESKKPETPQINSFTTEIDSFANCISSLRSYTNVPLNLKTYQNQLRKYQSLFLKPLSDSALNCFLIMSILKDSEDKTMLVSNLAVFIKKHNDIENGEIVKLIPNSLKPLYFQLLKVEKDIGKQIIDNNEQWYENTMEEYETYFNEVSKEVYILSGESKKENLKVLNQSKHDLSDWLSKREGLLKKYRKSITDLVVAQWHGSPEFLIAVQKEFIADSTIISWDEVRMIGWKISTALKTFNVSDMVEKINSVFKIKIDQNDSVKDSQFDGSYFSDVLHYIVETDISSYENKRDITKKMLSEILRPSEIKAICNYHSIDPNIEDDNLEILISKLGWKPSTKAYSTSLISFFENENDIIKLKSQFTAEDLNRLRKCLESYAKDIISVICSNIEKQGNELYDIVFNKFPHFNPTTSKKWHDQLSDDVFSLGSGIFIIKALGHEWKPDDSVLWENLTNNLTKASKLLNRPSHHSDIPKPIVEIIPELNIVFSEIISSTNKMVIEMPWHFQPQVVRGNDPSILTGKAWCHSYSYEKIIRILNWDYNGDLEPLLVWNPTKRNPIMTDCKIIKRVN
jgi:hypothetical protein